MAKKSVELKLLTPEEVHANRSAAYEFLDFWGEDTKPKYIAGIDPISKDSKCSIGVASGGIIEYLPRPKMTQEQADELIKAWIAATPKVSVITNSKLPVILGTGGEIPKQSKLVKLVNKMKRFFKYKRFDSRWEH